MKIDKAQEINNNWSVYTKVINETILIASDFFYEVLTECNITILL